ncbi:MAG: DUF2726 domain-containing protein [Planctomycetota bacterium]
MLATPSTDSGLLVLVIIVISIIIFVVKKGAENYKNEISNSSQNRVNRRKYTHSSSPKTGKKQENVHQELNHYVLARSLLTDAELNFKNTLENAVPRDTAIMCKVRMEDVVEVERGVEFRVRQQHRGHVKSRHFDFVICDRSSLRPLLAIELDDASHRSDQARMSDAKKDAICRVAGLPMLRVRVRGSYDRHELKRAIENAVN